VVEEEGGSGSFATVSGSLEIEPVSAIVSIGESKGVSLSVKNVGRVAANKCSLVGGEYIESDDIVNIGVGEIVDFMFVLNVLDEGVLDLNLRVECLEGVVGVAPLEIVLLVGGEYIESDEILFGEDGELLIRYNVEPVDSSKHVLIFSILNSVGGVVAEVSENVGLVFGEGYVGEVALDISDVKEGMLKVSVSDGGEVSFVEENFVYDGSLGVTGFAMMEWDGEVNYIGLVVFVFLILFGILGWRVWKLKFGK